MLCQLSTAKADIQAKKGGQIDRQKSLVGGRLLRYDLVERETFVFRSILEPPEKVVFAFLGGITKGIEIGSKKPCGTAILGGSFWGVTKEVV
jgi:hypothetical protein